ncbi:MAG: hypothetical protein F6J98_11340 [Moorea sp. SIO4G2]|nr:hypothetical protein [Moorena sp. SIO4G2]
MPKFSCPNPGLIFLPSAAVLVCDILLHLLFEFCVGFLPTPPNGIGFRRRCANGYKAVGHATRKASFIYHTGCPDPPEQYKKKVRFLVSRWRLALNLSSLLL